MSWAPNPESVQQILSVLRESLVSPKKSQPLIESLSRRPDWGFYLVHVLANLHSEPVEVRHMAGVLLRQHISVAYSRMPESATSVFKAGSLHLLRDPQPAVRKVGASLVVTLASAGDLRSWPELVPELVRTMTTPPAGSVEVEGALTALTLVCEDQRHLMDSEEIGRPLQGLVPLLVGLLGRPEESVRNLAMACLSEFVQDMPRSMLENVDALLRGIFSLTADTSPTVLQKVCRAFVNFADLHLDIILPHLTEIIRFMIAMMNHPDENTALEACEFWISMAATPVCAPAIRPFLPQLVPLLLSKMVMSKEDQAESVAEEQQVESEVERHASKPHFMGHDENGEDGDGESDVDDDGYEAPSEWNIRKCSAASLDELSNVYGDEILPLVMPCVQPHFITPIESWPLTECAVLAMGAISEGCATGLAQTNLSMFVLYLVRAVQEHPRAAVRSIVCWALSRYSRWIVAENERLASCSDPAVSSPLQPVLAALLGRVHDPVKKVQEAACSALSTLEEEARLALVPHLDMILSVIMPAFVRYQARNLVILYDAIGTLAESVGPELADPKYTSVLLPPLLNRWQSLGDEDPGLLPLLECLTSVVISLGAAFQLSAEPVYRRCMKLIESFYRQQAAALQDPCIPSPERDFCVCALDLIGGMTSGLGSAMDSLVASSDLMPLLVQCCRGSAVDIRQSAFALVGDLSRACFGRVAPFVNQCAPCLINNIGIESYKVCNNALWALGEIAKRGPSEIAPFVQAVLQRVVQLILNPPNKTAFKCIIDNAAICLGRLALVHAELVAALLPSFCREWCVALGELQTDEEERADAFSGFVRAVQKNAVACTPHLSVILEACGTWKFQLQPNQVIQQELGTLLQGFKALAGPSWEAVWASLSEPLRESLRQAYQL